MDPMPRERNMGLWPGKMVNSQGHFSSVAICVVFHAALEQLELWDVELTCALCYIGSLSP